MRVIKYKWSMHEKMMQPFFIGDMQNKIKLLGESINIKLDDKRCIGYNAGGRYHPCPHNTKIDTGWNCNSCRLKDDFFMCIKCNGEDCMNKKQKSVCEGTLYYIYLAAFDNVIKVGISNERRLIERLIEQGADFGAKIACVKDGKTVRLIEQSIRKHLGIVDFVRGESKQKMIFCNPNRCVLNINAAISSLKNNGFADHLVIPEIYDMREYYHLNKIMYNPEPVAIKTGMSLNGDVIAAKGNVIILKDKNRLYSINAHDMIGRDIEFTAN